MASRCQYCAALSISGLIDLAEKEFDNYDVPEQAFYRHHKSLDDLELSANSGCEFCTLILDCCKGTPVIKDDPKWIWRKEWIGSACKPEDSVLLYAKKQPATNIKIYLGASHVHPWPIILEDVRVFDVLSVSVGGQCTPLKLTLTIPRNDDIRVGKYRIGRFSINPNLGSESNFDIARMWLKNCQEKHLSCVRRDTAQLPTRVIDVGSKEGLQSIRIIHSQGMAAQYTALSHCWGGKISPVLTTATLEQFQELLPFDDLPANFRDAIIITRQLGIRYLWIDSLCIIQNPNPGSEDSDSKQDWEKECEKMGTYYGNSTLTISALGSERSTQGILNRIDNLPRPKPAKLRVYPDSEQSYEVTVEKFNNEEKETLKGLDNSSALALRGWAFQESLLSPRQLYYGKRQIYWKCRHGFEAGDGLPSLPGYRTPRFDFAKLSPILHGDLPSGPTQLGKDTDVLAEYYRLAETYSKKKLTYKSDKLPAFSGLAQRIRAALPEKCEYLAGLWSHEIHRGLAWHRRYPNTAMHCVEYRAPSWSWANTDDPITYDDEFEFENDKFQLQLLSWSMSLCSPNNPYGEIKAGHVVVQGYTTPLVRSQQTITMRRGKEGDYGHATYDEPDTEVPPTASSEYMAVVILRDDGSLIGFCNQTWVDKEGCPIDPDAFLPAKHLVLLIGMTRYEAECIILRQVTGRKEREFERVGHLYIWEPNLTWIEKWDKQELRLV